MIKRIIALILAVLTVACLASCKESEPISVTGTYTWEKEGAGSAFTITLREDGSYQYYAGMLSSYIGVGEWTLDGDTVKMTEDVEACGYPNVFYFKVKDDALVYVKKGSSSFMYVDVEDGDRFDKIEINTGDVVTRFLECDEEGNYLGFSDIPENYDAIAAAHDGCLVIDTVNEKVGNLTETKERNTYGYERWKKFEELSSAGEDAFIRVVHFINGVGYYSDLYYCDGKYILFETNPELGTNKICEFKYLRHLEGTILSSGTPQKKHCYCVLTDSLELTYEDVSRSIFASSSWMVSDIPFEWLGFMTYFNHGHIE